MKTLNVPIMATLNNLTDRGVYAFVNETDKKIYISYSTYILGAVARILRELKNGSHISNDLCEDLDKLEVKVLEESSTMDLKLRATYFAKEYENNGYKLYRPVNYVQYSVKRRYEKGNIVVELVTNSYNRSFVVGVFGKNEDALKFINEYYPNPDNIYRIVYANNKATKDYLEFQKWNS